MEGSLGHNADVLFGQIGVPIVAGQLYQRLLVQGSLAYEDVETEASGPSQTRPLDWLEEHGFAVTADGPIGKIVLPQNPSIVCGTLYSRHLWSVVPSEDGVCALPDRAKAELEAYRTACQALESLLLETYVAVSHEPGLMMVDAEAAPRNLALALASATRCIRGVTAPPWLPDIALIWSAIQERIGSGVEYLRLADPITLVAFGFAIGRRDVYEAGVRLRIVKADALREKCFIVDDTEAFVFLPNLSGSDLEFRASRVNVKELVGRFISLFDTSWQDGVPAEEALDALSAVRENFVERAAELGSIEKAVASGVFDLGIYYRPNYNSIDEQQEGMAIQRLIEIGLLRRISPSDCRPIANVVEDTSRLLGLL